MTNATEAALVKAAKAAAKNCGYDWKSAFTGAFTQGYIHAYRREQPREAAKGALKQTVEAYNAGYEAFWRDESEAYVAACADEPAWLGEDAPVNEYDHEAQADLDLHNELHPHGYC